MCKIQSYNVWEFQQGFEKVVISRAKRALTECIIICNLL